ncbi:hypothetical protein RHMOL_Rhmol04G0186100 [Rhododendron molle]|uniref:Uncharacterized protein n=1 Tax=Rhododendron molle TaxID=49168 RepID=A0ACC0P1W1_RHOML|nr:hypothetical protein RHMOL_Rhmol04G0186100 [Rhododendron molle]
MSVGFHAYYSTFTERFYKHLRVNPRPKNKRAQSVTLAERGKKAKWRNKYRGIGENTKSKEGQCQGGPKKKYTFHVPPPFIPRDHISAFSRARRNRDEFSRGSLGEREELEADRDMADRRGGRRGLGPGHLLLVPVGELEEIA